MVIGAMPMPAETSDTARLRWVSNQPVTQAIIGAKIAAVAAADDQAEDQLELDQRCRPAGQGEAGRQDDRSGQHDDTRPDPVRQAPQTMLASAMARKPMVMALEMPVTDQPVSRAIGSRKTGSENMAPIATQPSRPPAATITQR